MWSRKSSELEVTSLGLQAGFAANLPPGFGVKFDVFLDSWFKLSSSCSMSFTLNST